MVDGGNFEGSGCILVNTIKLIMFLKSRYENCTLYGISLLWYTHLVSR